jgi:hypothetical protein
MADMRAAHRLLHGVREFMACDQSTSRWPRVASAVAALQTALEEEGLPDIPVHPGRPVGTRVPRKLRDAWRYARNRIQALNKKSLKELAVRSNGQISLLWFLRVAFAPPNVSLRALTEFCRDFSADQSSVISHEYVSRVRDAFAQILRGLAQKQVGALARAHPAAPLFVSHIHDEAGMRIRSYQHAPDTDPAPGGQRCARGRSTKVQNNVVRVAVAGRQVNMYVELQALLRKDASTIAQAMRNILQEARRSEMESDGWDRNGIGRDFNVCHSVFERRLGDHSGIGGAGASITLARDPFAYR